MDRGFDSKAPETVGEVIDLLAEKGALPAAGLTPSHARVIKARNSIPSTRYAAIVDAAAKHRLPITFELLARLRDQPAARGMKKHHLPIVAARRSRRKANAAGNVA